MNHLDSVDPRKPLEMILHEFFWWGVCFFEATITAAGVHFYRRFSKESSKNEMQLAAEHVVRVIAGVIYWTYPSGNFYVYCLLSST